MEESSERTTLCKPLEGVNIVEVGSYLAAPLVGTHLLHLGAAVTTVLPPIEHGEISAEEAWRPETQTALRQGKTLRRINLKSAEGQKALRGLIRKANVLLVGHRSSTIAKLGLTAAACHEVNSNLVHVVLPAFATSDTEFADVPGVEAAIMAAAGVFSDMGINRQLSKQPASYSPLPLASAYASATAALAVVTALTTQTRRGTTSGATAEAPICIEVPLASSLLDCLVHNSMQFDEPSVYQSRRRRELQRRDEGAPPLDYFDVLDLTDPFYSHYTCADARPIYLVAPCHAAHQQRALQALGIADAVAELGIPNAVTYGGNKADEEASNDGAWHGIGAGQVGDMWAAGVRKLMKRAFLTRPAYEWELVLGKAGVPVAAHRSTSDWLTSQHAREAGLVLEDDVSHAIRPGPIAWVLEDAANPPNESAFKPSQPPPSPRQPSTDGSGSESDSTSPSSGWLSGIKVLDLANVIAGPTIGSTLARYGAEVIKVDAPTPSYSPEITVVYGLAANAGKRSILLDAKDEAGGRAAIEALIRRCDVVVLNATSEGADRLGMTPARLREIHPDVVLARFDAYGGPNEKGPLASHLGYDDNLQAALGIMERFGGGLGRVEEHAHVGTIDVVAGVGGALSVTAALLLRERRRRLQPLAPPRMLVARASLASLGQLVQYPFCCGQLEQLRSEAATASTRLGPECRGEHALMRCYKAADEKWFLLCPSVLRTCPAPSGGRAAAKPEQAMLRLGCAHPQLFAAIDSALGQARAGQADADDTLASSLASIFASTFSAHEWVALLRRTGVDSTLLASMSALRAKHIRPASAVDVTHGAPTFQFLQYKDHPVGTLTLFAPCSVRLSVPGLSVPLSHAPKYGAHTVEVLQSAHIEVTPLLQRGAAAISWSTQYLPAPGASSAALQGTVVQQCKPQVDRSKHPGCPVCLGDMTSAIQLSCSHSLCVDCAERCSKAGHERCPVCRHPHLLDPTKLGERRDAWRTAYGGWRKGRASGAAGEIASIVSPSSRSRRGVHSRSAGDLILQTPSGIMDGADLMVKKVNVQQANEVAKCALTSEIHNTDPTTASEIHV